MTPGSRPPKCSPKRAVVEGAAVRGQGDEGAVDYSGCFPGISWRCLVLARLRRAREQKSGRTLPAAEFTGPWSFETAAPSEGQPVRHWLYVVILEATTEAAYDHELVHDRRKARQKFADGNARHLRGDGLKLPANFSWRIGLEVEHVQVGRPPPGG